MTRKKTTLPSDKMIEEKKIAFKSLIEKIASGELDVKTKKETVLDKLALITDELLLLKDKAIPYSTMSGIIEEHLGLKVSDQTLRSFCQNRLGFPKKERKAVKKKELSSLSEKTNTGYNASKELSGNNETFD